MNEINIETRRQDRIVGKIDCLREGVRDKRSTISFFELKLWSRDSEDTGPVGDGNVRRRQDRDLGERGVKGLVRNPELRFLRIRKVLSKTSPVSSHVRGSCRMS